MQVQSSQSFGDGVEDRMRIMLGKGQRAESVCENLIMLQRERRLQTEAISGLHRYEVIGETVEILLG